MNSLGSELISMFRGVVYAETSQMEFESLPNLVLGGCETCWIARAIDKQISGPFQPRQVIVDLGNLEREEI
jgi:hypothetical protein